MAVLVFVGSQHSNNVTTQGADSCHVWCTGAQDPTHLADEHCELQSKESMLFAATAIANGSGMAVVNSIGMATEIGKIQSQIQEAAKEEDDTPLKKKLDEFGEALAKVCHALWPRSGPPAAI